jgi:2'-5' RNA ligase
MRLFIAIELPDDVKRELGGLWMDIPGVRRVPTEQIHLTLAFLGEVEESAAERLAGELSRIQLPGFHLCFSGPGCFPDRRRPRVLWIGLEPHLRLRRLASGVHEAVLACGIPQEERPFSPHITLARLSLPPPRMVDAYLDRNKTLNLPPFPVHEFTLFRSRLTPQGALHTPLRSFSLEAAGGDGRR